MFGNAEPARPLTAREQAFVAAFVVCFNGTEAARQSGAGKQAAITGSRMLHNQHVRAAIREALEGMVMSAEEVLTRMSLMAMASLEDFIDDTGNIDMRRAKARGLSFLVKKYKTRTTTNMNTRAATTIVEIELHDSQAALIQLGKYFELWVDRTEHSGPNGGPIQVEDVKARLLSRFNQVDAARHPDVVPERADE